MGKGRKTVREGTTKGRMWECGLSKGRLTGSEIGKFLGLDSKVREERTGSLK